MCLDYQYDKKSRQRLEKALFHRGWTWGYKICGVSPRGWVNSNVFPLRRPYRPGWVTCGPISYGGRFLLGTPYKPGLHVYLRPPDGRIPSYEVYVRVRIRLADVITLGEQEGPTAVVTQMWVPKWVGCPEKALARGGRRLGKTVEVMERDKLLNRMRF